MKTHVSKRFHIIIDAYNCQNTVLTDRDRVRHAIEAITKLCHRHILHGPVVVKGVVHNPGITGFAVIDDSHISIHTFAATKEICVDVFSCRPFDYEKVKEFVKKTFDLDDRFIEYVEVQHQLH